MITLTDRKKASTLIIEAIASGARKSKACSELGITIRTYQRWHSGDAIQRDRRTTVKRSKPSNTLSIEEKSTIIKICNQEEYKSLPPSQIVPMLADQGIYIASESSFYRVLKDAKQLQHRGKALPSIKRHKPDEYKAIAPNQVWSWDITFLPTLIKGSFFRLYTNQLKTPISISAIDLKPKRTIIVR